AYFQVDASGTPFAGGGFDATLRDLARFGQMMLQGGRWQGRQIIPREAVEDIRFGGSAEPFARSEYGHKLPGWSYRNMWWVSNNPDGAYMARGVHGQAIYIDPTAEMVIVRLASNPDASNTLNDYISLPAYQAVADMLKKSKR
ncbi:MAG: serine hydrolase, partial [Tidjanibacter sp.]|nr:serine hydrolase [Tidjanibacter sp.]